MLRTAMLAASLSAVALGGCSSRTLMDETARVGSVCSAGTTGVVSGLGLCGMALGTHEAGYIWGTEASLHLAFCNVTLLDCESIAGEFHVFVTSPSVGTFTVESGAVRFTDASSGDRASSGTVRIDGYDPMSRSVCGSFDVRLGGETFVGDFEADGSCGP